MFLIHCFPYSIFIVYALFKLALPPSAFVAPETVENCYRRYRSIECIDTAVLQTRARSISTTVFGIFGFPFYCIITKEVAFIFDSGCCATVDSVFIWVWKSVCAVRFYSDRGGLVEEPKKALCSLFPIFFLKY